MKIERELPPDSQLLGILESAIAFNTSIHEEMTVENLELETVFTSEEMETIVEANKGQDGLVYGQLHPEYHFDNNRLLASEIFVNSQYDLIARTKEKREALEAFGKILHAQQDFYAHTNYVEIYRDYFMSKQQRYPSASEIPLYSEVLQDSAFKALAEKGLKSGIFSVTDYLLKDIPNLNHDPDSHEKINKDEPGRPFFEEAKDLAERQTDEETRRFLETLRQNPFLNHWKPDTPHESNTTQEYC